MLFNKIYDFTLIFLFCLNCLYNINKHTIIVKKSDKYRISKYKKDKIYKVNPNAEASKSFFGVPSIKMDINITMYVRTKKKSGGITKTCVA